MWKLFLMWVTPLARFASLVILTQAAITAAVASNLFTAAFFSAIGLTVAFVFGGFVGDITKIREYLGGG